MFKVIKFDEKYRDLLLKRIKTRTMRLDTKDLKINEQFLVKLSDDSSTFGFINKIYRQRIFELSEKELKAEGYKTRDNLYKDLKKYFPETTRTTYFWVLEFFIV